MPRDRFYNTRTWKRLRRLKLARNPLCEVCGRPASDVDHTKSINSGGDPYAMDNLRSLCHDCHSRKTYYVERLGRDRVPVKGCRSDGTPLDPQHHWNRDTSVQGSGEIVRPEPYKREKKFADSSGKDRGRTFACSKFEVNSGT
jgi:5-methylcytosine-specific restriction enzyme A